MTIQNAAPKMQSAEQALRTARSFGMIIKLGFVLAAILGFWYLTLLNSIATRGFVLSELKNERQLLQRELELVDIRLTIPTSLYALGSSEQVQEMAVIEDKEFLRVRDDQVAMVTR